MNHRIVSTLAMAGCLVALPSIANAQSSVACPGGTCTYWTDTDIDTPTVWGDGSAAGGGSTNTIILDGPTFVTDRLTILPGTIVRGQPRTLAFDDMDPIPGSPGALIVSQDGYADMQGQANNPIIMTTAAPDVDGDGVADDEPEISDPNDPNDPNEPMGPPNTANGRNGWTDGNAFLDDDPEDNPLAPLALDGSQNVQLWGGFVILGKAPTNLEDEFSASGADYGQATVEGLAVPNFPAAGAIYGGDEPHDCSGIFRHISVRHAGDVIGEANELNGVTLGGVGDCTIYENIEVYTNQDDGHEYFGGTLNSKNLVAAFVGDDSLDLDQGYNGSIQFVLATSTFFNQDDGTDYGNGGSGDGLGEWDGDDNGSNVNIQQSFDDADTLDKAWPVGATAVYNFTGMGNQFVFTPDPNDPDPNNPTDPNNPAVSDAGPNRGIRMRNDFEGILANSIVVNTSNGIGMGDTACYTVEAPDLNDNPGLVHVIATTCSDTEAPDAGGQAAAGRGDDGVAAGQYEGGSDNFCDAGCDGGAAAANILAQEDTRFEPKCAAAGTPGHLDGCKATPIDPRPAVAAPAAQVGGGIGVTGTGLDRSATYRGAFPAGVDLWTDGWTALDAGDLL